MFRSDSFAWLRHSTWGALLILTHISTATAGGGSSKISELTISGTPPTSVVVGQRYDFTPTTTGYTSGDRFAISNKPSWARFHERTGTLSGTPSAADIGVSSDIEINVTHRSQSASLPVFSIRVTPANVTPPPSPTPPAPPTISGSPATAVTAGSLYSFQPTASDPRGLPLSFSVQNKPAWASFSIASGQLSGTPASSQAGTYSGIVISTSDGSASAALAAFNITVSTPAATAPTISGSPASTLTLGSTYSFTPTVGAANGASLAFRVQNEPAWATFNTTTGQLSGTPTTAGSYANIVITVSDAAGSASLPQFSITVTQPPATTGSATVIWSAPTQNTDGTGLTNLSGYQIYYGTSAGNLTQSVKITNPGVLTYLLTGLASGTWYFAVQADTSAGGTSALSNPASFSVP
jgi:hypothetical protein